MEMMNFEASDEMAHFVESKSWKDLDAIHLTHVNFAILKRPAMDVSSVVEEMIQKRFRSFQFTLGASDDADIVAAALDEEVDLQCSGAIEFLTDLSGLVRRFFEVSRASEIGIRLETVSSNACALFHVDQVGLRLVTTYLGPGSDWLLNEDVNRSGLAKQRNELVMASGARIQRLQTGNVGIMKGEKFLGNRNRGLVHRSPEIDGSGLTRLLLRMDTLDSPV